MMSLPIQQLILISLQILYVIEKNPHTNFKITQLKLNIILITIYNFNFKIIMLQHFIWIIILVNERNKAVVNCAYMSLNPRWFLDIQLVQF